MSKRFEKSLLEWESSSYMKAVKIVFMRFNFVGTRVVRAAARYAATGCRMRRHPCIDSLGNPVTVPAQSLYALSFAWWMTNIQIFPIPIFPIFLLNSYLYISSKNRNLATLFRCTSKVNEILKRIAWKFAWLFAEERVLERKLISNNQINKKRWTFWELWQLRVMDRWTSPGQKWPDALISSCFFPRILWQFVTKEFYPNKEIFVLLYKRQL